MVASSERMRWAMADQRKATVRLIGEPITVTAWLAKLDNLGMALGVVPPRRIAGGSYDGGWVVSADNARGWLYFAVNDRDFGILGPHIVRST